MFLRVMAGACLPAGGTIPLVPPQRRPGPPAGTVGQGGVSPLWEAVWGGPESGVPSRMVLGKGGSRLIGGLAPSPTGQESSSRRRLGGEEAAIPHWSREGRMFAVLWGPVTCLVPLHRGLQTTLPEAGVL